MQGRKKKLLGFLLLLLMVAAVVPTIRAKAAGEGLQITEINYENETLTVKTTNSDSYLYYSDEKKRTWEWAGEFPESGEFVLDISWVKKTKDYVMVFRGDKSDEISVTLPQQNKSFKVTYNYKDECLRFTNDDKQAVYWRKADSTVWKPVTITDGKMDTQTLDAFRRLYARGATLYLCTWPVNGTSASAAGVRPSKEVKFSLKKQATAPKLSVKLPGTVAVTDKMEYQVAGADTWTACSGKTLDLKEAAPEAYYKETTPGKETRVYVRVAATEKALPSANATVTVRAQEAAPEPYQKDDTKETGQIESGLANAMTLKFTFHEVKETDADGKEVVKVEKPSSKNPYEYTVVLKDEQLKDDAKWTAITSESVEIDSTKAPEGSTVYIRKKGKVESTLVWQPESQAYTHTVEKYPEGSTWEDAASIKDGILYLVKEEGVEPKGLEFNIILQSPNTDVKSITCGSKALKFTSTISEDGNKVHVVITDTSDYEAAVTDRDKEQEVKITLANGEVLNKARLTILHGASVSGEPKFTITHGLEPSANTPYTFVVNPGLTLEKTGSEADAEHGKTTVASLTFMGEGIAFTPPETQTDGSYKIQFTAKAFDKVFLNWGIELDKELPLTIEMSNGQKITKGVSITLHEPIKSETVQTATIEEGKAAKDIELIFTADVAGASIKEIYWNGQRISKQAAAVDTKITVVITKEAINGLKFPVDAVDSTSFTAPIVFELLDGSQASQVYQLTLTRALAATP